MPSFLFVCLANQIRSPIAAATFRSAWLALPGAKPCRVASAGTWTRSGMPVSPAAMAYAATFGIDLRHFRTTSIEQVKLAEYDYIIVMEKGQQEALSIEHPELQPAHPLAGRLGRLLLLRYPRPRSGRPGYSHQYSAGYAGVRPANRPAPLPAHSSPGTIICLRLSRAKKHPLRVLF